MATKPAQTQVCPETYREKIARIMCERRNVPIGSCTWDAYLADADAILAVLELLPSGQGSLRAQLIGISERLRDEVPAAAIPAVHDAVIQLRILGESLPTPPSIEKSGGEK